MWIGAVSRKQLLDVFEPQGSAFPMILTQRDDLTDIPIGQDYTLVWKKDPRIETHLPVMMVLAPQNREDFLAWAATYLPTIKPFTAYCRVLDAAEVATNPPIEGPSLQNLEECCLGLILGEAATYSNGRFDPKQLTLAAYSRTYSFVMSRSLALGMPDGDEGISNNWQKLRRLTRQPKLSVDFSVLESVWVILLSVLSSGLPGFGPASMFQTARFIDRRHSSISRKISDYLVEAVWALLNKGDLSSYDWQLMTRAFPELNSALDDVKGTREERVRSLDRYLACLVKAANRDQLTASFMAGYLTSQVSPGSFDHSSLLMPHLPTLNSSILWYGLAAGASKEPQLKKYALGLGRRVLRDLLRSESLYDRPTCDIAISELEVLMRGEGNQATELKSSVHGLLDVEIAPCVTSTVRWPLESEAMQSSINRHSEQELRSLVNDLSQAIVKTENVRQRLSKFLDPSRTQEELDKKKKRR